MSGPSAANRSISAPAATAVSMVGKSCAKGTAVNSMVTLAYCGSLATKASAIFSSAISESSSCQVRVDGDRLALGEDRFRRRLSVSSVGDAWAGALPPQAARSNAAATSSIKPFRLMGAVLL